MTLLNLLYWIILILACIGVFAPYEVYPRVTINSIAWIILFVVIGLKIFRTPLQ
jgi:hypothetical protein